jgi:superkiller protein 3
MMVAYPNTRIRLDRGQSADPLFSSVLPAALVGILLVVSGCVRNVQKISNDNFYVVRATDKRTIKNGARPSSAYQRIPESSELISQNDAPHTARAGTSVTNADILEEKHPMIAALLRKIDQNPDLGQTHYELAVVYHQMKLFDKACLEYQKAMDADPKEPSYYESYGRLWRDWGIPESGIHYLQRALELRPAYPEAWNTLGTIYDDLGNLSSAEEYYLRADEINSELDFVHSNLCFHYIQAGQPQEAIRHGERAVYLNPDLSQARNNLGVAYSMAGKVVQAIEQFRFTGDEAEAHNNLGVVFLKIGRNAEAREEFKLAVRLKPFYSVAAQNYRIANSRLQMASSSRGSGINLQKWSP